MKLDENGKRLTKDGLRLGYTTGSCAAAASLAAAKLLEGEKLDRVSLVTPAGIELELEVIEPTCDGVSATAGIRKDAGDDSDATDGMIIRARVSKRNDGKVIIDGGVGIGVITKKGLFGKVGEKAINPVPRRMIEEAVTEVNECGYNVEIFAPEGELIGARTYNRNLGIEGGISIIGSTGIVYPMSEEALLKTIDLEIEVVKAEHGTDDILLVPGNYGERMREDYKIELPHVQMSNFIGEALKYAYNKGFRRITLLGHIGKFAKLALGIFNTHSKNCDTRLEAFVYYLFMADAPRDFILKISETNTAEEAMNLCIENGYGEVIKQMERGAESRIKRYLKDESLEVKVYIYSMEKGLAR